MSGDGINKQRRYFLIGATSVVGGQAWSVLRFPSSHPGVPAPRRAHSARRSPSIFPA